jgi:hypothetical protein
VSGVRRTICTPCRRTRKECGECRNLNRLRRFSQQHLDEMHHYIAKVGTTGSALRNQGGSGLRSAAITFLSGINLRQLSGQTTTYRQWLDAQTNALMGQFPVSDLWGPARKVVNIFMVMTSLNIFLRTVYGLDRFENVLEVPLDNTVEKKLRQFGLSNNMFPTAFPQWQSIKGLTQPNSDKYQQIADSMSNHLGVPRGRLDVILF